MNAVDTTISKEVKQNNFSQNIICLHRRHVDPSIVCKSYQSIGNNPFLLQTKKFANMIINVIALNECSIFRAE